MSRRPLYENGEKPCGDRDGALLRLRVGEHRSDDRRALQDVERQLSGVLVLEVADRELLVRARTRDRLQVLVDLDAVVRAEEPDLVLHDEPAEVRAELLAHVLRQEVVRPERRLLDVALPAEVRRLDDLDVGAHAGIVVVTERAAVELVSTRLRDDVDDAARVAAVLGLVAARLHLDFLDELVVDVLALEALDDVRRVDAVDQEQVLRRRRPIDRDRQRTALRLAEVRLHARLREHDVRVVAADRQLVDDLGAVVAPLRRRRHVDERRLARDRHLGRRRDRQLQVDRRRRVEPDRRRLLHLAEVGELRRDLVLARRNAREPIAAVRSRDRRSAALQVRARRSTRSRRAAARRSRRRPSPPPFPSSARRRAPVRKRRTPTARAMANRVANFIPRSPFRSTPHHGTLRVPRISKG